MHYSLDDEVQVTLDDSNANKSTLGLGRAIRSDSQLINQLMRGESLGEGNEGGVISTASRTSWGQVHAPSCPTEVVNSDFLGVCESVALGPSLALQWLDCNNCEL